MSDASFLFFACQEFMITSTFVEKYGNLGGNVEMARWQQVDSRVIIRGR